MKKDYYDSDYLEKTQSDIIKNYDNKALISNAFYFEGITTENKKVLEFGAGIGQNIDLLSNAYAYDISQFGMQYCISRGIKTFNNINEIPNNYFDIILSAHCLEHLENPLENLKLLRRKLKTNGLLIVILPIENNLEKPYSLDYIPDKDYHLYTWNFRTINNLLCRANFEILENNYIFTSMYDLLSRLPISRKLYLYLIRKLGDFNLFNPKKELRVVAMK